MICGDDPQHSGTTSHSFLCLSGQTELEIYTVFRMRIFLKDGLHSAWEQTLGFLKPRNFVDS